MEHKLVHIVEKGQEVTLCKKDIMENHLHHTWLLPTEHFKKKIVIYNSKENPTCPLCLKSLELMGIEIIREF